MKITILSALLCVAAAAAAATIHKKLDHGGIDISPLERRNNLAAVANANGITDRKQKRINRDEHGVEIHKNDKRHDDDDDGEKEKDDKDKKKKDSGDKDDDDEDDDEKKKNDDERKKDGEGKKNGEGKKEGEGGKDGEEKKDPAKKDGKTPTKGGAAPKPNADPAPSQAELSPLWIVQPVGGSVWEHGRTYVIVWGPNPDASYAKNLEPKSSIDIRLMHGPPEKLSEVAVLKAAADSSEHKLEWVIPATILPAKDYTIRITHEGKVDTYSHYFEVVETGDPRSSKSNVGEPLEMPKKGDKPMPLNKGPVIKPANPPNPLPQDKPAVNKPATDEAAKPASQNSAGASEFQRANMLAFAMTLFGAVYFL
ncbi:hypothetical protein BGX28_007507 [Mortierella sp. GBA30]|nr:hypothetical protein BGX28_007507 [Mortierella sp. GBA30]